MQVVCGIYVWFDDIQTILNFVRKEKFRIIYNIYFVELNFVFGILQKVAKKTIKKMFCQMKIFPF